jgi:two-component system LytT family sensor kinase
MKPLNSTLLLDGSRNGFWRHVPLFWRLQLMGWTVFAILVFPVNMVLSGTVAAAFCSVIVRNGFSFALTLGMRAIYAKVYHKLKKPGWIAATIFIASMTAGLLQLPFHYVLGDLFPFEEKTIFDQSIYLAIFYYRTGLFTCWSLMYFGIRQMREVIEDELRLALIKSEKRGAELQMLRAQMNPHFLFNALNAILAAIDKPREQLKALVRALADYLRYSLETRNEERVQLGQEYDAILSYMAVEKARFREKLEIECIIDPDARKLLVPGIIIQPLVENAIKYGRKSSPHPLKVRVNISTFDSDCVQIEVSNTGKWIEPNPSNTLGGVGLENLKSRLNLLYPNSHSFRISSENGWVTVQIQILATP